MDKFVVGQHEAKRVLSVGVYQHYKRLASNHELKRQQAISAGLQQNGTSSHHHHVSGANVPSNMFQSGNLNNGYGPTFAGGLSNRFRSNISSTVFLSKIHF